MMSFLEICATNALETMPKAVRFSKTAGWVLQEECGIVWCHPYDKKDSEYSTYSTRANHAIALCVIQKAQEVGYEWAYNVGVDEVAEEVFRTAVELPYV